VHVHGLPCMQITVGAVLPGYVANVVNDAVFVRFAGGVTGGHVDRPTERRLAWRVSSTGMPGLFLTPIGWRPSLYCLILLQLGLWPLLVLQELGRTTYSSAPYPSTIHPILFPAVKLTVSGCLLSLAGRAGLSQLADTLVSDPHRIFRVGQSVRAQVVTLDLERSRFNLTLKPSLTASTDASYAAALFRYAWLEAQLHVCTPYM
jgi:predicted RNA-binding protein with RPS1 domain